MSFISKFTKKDFYFSITTGFITGFIAWRVLIFLNVPELAGISAFWLIAVIPVLWILGVNLGYFLGKWLDFFNQFGKFSAIGFTNGAVYFGILNILIFFSGANRGLWYSVFVAVAFTIAVSHSYFWNKFWAFSSEGKVSGKEFGKFFSVYVVAGLLNVGIASGLVNFIKPLFGLTLDQWANTGGIAGSAIALTFSFIGLRLKVFKK